MNKPETERRDAEMQALVWCLLSPHSQLDASLRTHLELEGLPPYERSHLADTRELDDLHRQIVDRVGGIPPFPLLKSMSDAMQPYHSPMIRARHLNFFFLSTCHGLCYLPGYWVATAVRVIDERHLLTGRSSSLGAIVLIDVCSAEEISLGP